jgi:hypothetical protein
MHIDRGQATPPQQSAQLVLTARTAATAMQAPLGIATRPIEGGLPLQSISLHGLSPHAGNPLGPKTPEIVCTRLGMGMRQNLFNAGLTQFNFAPGGLTQTQHAFSSRLPRHLSGAALTQNQLGQGLTDRHDLKHTDTT